MNRAHADEGLREIALALARYLSCECRPDPNPSGHRPAPAADAVKVSAIAISSENTTPPLVPDLEYTIAEAALVTNKAEATIRKYLSLGRLQGRKVGTRVYLTGAELARFLVKQDLTAPDDAHEAVEP